MIGIFVDISDIYHKVNRKFGGKVDYFRYMDTVIDEDKVYRAYAYGSQRGKEAVGFITCLRKCGFEPKYKAPKIVVVGDREIKHCDWGICIAVDIIHLIDKLDTIILGTSNPDFIPLIQLCQDRGKKVIVFACCVPVSLREAANEVIEINQSMLEE